MIVSPGTDIGAADGKTPRGQTGLLPTGERVPAWKMRLPTEKDMESRKPTHTVTSLVCVGCQ